MLTRWCCLLATVLCLDVTNTGCHGDTSKDTETVTEKEQITWDSKGYVIFCLCMGRFGNQAEHFLGGLAFAKSLDRTLILPPFRTYKNVEFDEWFSVSAVQEYHRVILAKDFMAELAPAYWPPGNRTGMCYTFNTETGCNMKEGNPFGPFWDGLGVDFDEVKPYTISREEVKKWKDTFPSEKYPVLALRGAPASFPVQKEHVSLQKYIRWSDSIEQQSNEYIQQTFQGQPFVGIHLRNGLDWSNACKHVDGTIQNFMASPQCMGYRNKKSVTKEMCLPSTEEILRLTKEAVIATKAKFVYVATDKTPLVKELEEHLDNQVKVIHHDPWLPQLDLAILGKSDHFIGNCVSSFTSFVSRLRLVDGKPTSYWGNS